MIPREDHLRKPRNSHKCRRSLKQSDKYCSSPGLQRISYVVVMQDGNYLGIMSERDYTHKVKLQGRKSETTTVKDIMSSDYPVVGYGEDLQRCMVLMNVYKTRYLPIFDEMNFQGVLTMNDLMREVIAKDNLSKPDTDSLYEL